MDREWDPMPDAAEEDGEQVEPADAAAPSPRQQATHPSEHNSEEIQEVTSVSTATENGAAGPVNAEENEDDDVVLVGEEEAPQDADISETAADATATPDAPAANDAMATDDAAAPVAMRLSDAPSPPTSSGCVAAKSSATEPIVIDDDEESEQQREAGNAAGGSPGALSCMEPDSEIKIASVTTLGSPEQQGGVSLSACAGVTSAVEPDAVEPAQADLNLMITSVTSLQAGATAIIAAEENGLQISSAFSLSADAASFNPGRGSASTNQAVQNGDGGTHPRTDSWISQSASFPRNQKQTGVDSPSPAPSLPKPQGQSSSSSSGSQPPPRTVKVTCANCKKPLKKGQTAYQRKGSTHLFCSTTCLSAFSHKPAPKKNCTMCKKDITTMKGTIVAQVDSSESFQEFCSTGCLGAYEHPPKSSLKTKCTVCGKLTEIRHEVSFKTVTHKICSDACFNTYRMANGLIMNCCEQCGDYLPTRAAANHSLLVDGQHKRFCCQNCIKEFKQVNSKLASCVICKTLIKTGEVLHGVGAGGTVGSYCSSACMNKGKMATTATILKPTCHVCKSNSLPQYQATLPEGSVLNFCSSQCVTKFQNSTFQTATNGQTPLATTNNVQLKCNYCRGAFRLKPEVLEWEDKVYQFCSKSCCEDYKKLHCIVTFCEYCQEEKTLHETVNFSGVKKPFCSEGCKLLFKQDFIRRLGLKCVSCNHCSQLCKRAVTRQLGGMTRDFCGESCAKKFHDWYYKAARCDCCKVQGSLTESVQWRMEMKHFCDQECLLRFYCQQNEPIMVTQKGPENTSLGFQVQGAKLGLLNQYAGGGMMRDVKNKAVLCKPLTLTKATYCKPHMQSKMLQTDVDDGVKREYVPVPIPVPVFIPVPMNMYTQATPTPISLPIPVPVPVFLPTTLQGAEQIIKTISELKTEVSADPPPTDLLCTEGLTPDDQKPEIKTVTVTVKEHGAGESSSSPSSRGSEEEEGEEEEKYEPELDLESDFPQAPDPVPSLEGLEDDMDFTLPPVLVEEKQEPVPQSQPNGQGNKRRAVEGVACSPRSADGHREERRLPLKARYGVNAWRRWALSSSDQSEDAKETDASKPASGTRSKGNLLSLSPEELSLALGRFVREVSRPNGERYAPDSILYLCLGIQQHLRAKGRKDDLFGDSCYQQFGEQLNRILKDWKPSVLPDGSLWGRVEEQALWSSGQLGAQSPAALLRSLVYLNTKHLGLRTAEQHLRLSFANVYGPDAVHPVTKETSVCGRVPSPSQEHSVQTGSSNRKRKAEDEDPDDGSGSCGVNNQECCIYELYRTKCPASVLHRLDVFYVQPRPACDPGAAPLWFDSTPLERSVLEGLLTRALLVRDVYTTAPAPPQVEEEEEEAAAQGGGGGDEGE